MLRLLHTADWQLGSAAKNVGRFAGVVHDQRIATVESLLSLADKLRVDAVLVAGDIFEHPSLGRDQVQQIVRRLDRFSVDVYLLPGNHDPLAAGAVWNHPAWSSTRRLHVVRSSDPISLRSRDGDEVLVLPAPCARSHSPTDPTDVFSDHPPTSPTGQPFGPGEGPIRVGLAHGTLQTIPQEHGVLDYPIATDAATRHGLDYLALGHWHSPRGQADAGGAVRTAYSGTPETTGFREQASGYVLEVRIEGPGAEPTIVPHHVGHFLWIQHALTIHAASPASGHAEPLETHQIQDGLGAGGDAGAVGTLGRLVHEITAGRFDRLLPRDPFARDMLIGGGSAIPLPAPSPHDPARLVLRLALTGLVEAMELPELARVEELLGDALAHASVYSDGIVTMPPDESWLGDLPAGPVRQAARELADLASQANQPAGDAAHGAALANSQGRGEEPEPDADPRVAREALLVLYSELMTHGSEPLPEGAR